MRVAYFDAAVGASGDMVLGALVAAGVELAVLQGVVEQLGLEGVTVTAEPVKKSGIAATKVAVNIPAGPQPHRHLSHIVRLLEGSSLPAEVAERATTIFTRLAEAEARVHGCSVEQVHFHEVGAVDALVDVVGAVAGLAALGVERVYCSPLPVGHGWVDCAHGRLPVPAPAVLELLTSRPTRPLEVEGETLTPTGAAILTTLAAGYELPPLTTDRVGYGAGSRELPVPNLLRLLVGETAEQPAEVVVIEANVDDMNPEWYERAVERIFAAGALDVTLSPLQMKKGRPGVLVKVIVDPARREAVTEVIFRETTTLGVRWFAGHRECLARDWLDVSTRYGTIQVKLGRWRDELVQVAPEYASCRARAEACGVSLPAVYAAAADAARLRLEPATAMATVRGEEKTN